MLISKILSASALLLSASMTFALAAPASADEQMTLKSVDVEFPADRTPEFPAGPQVDAVNTNCLMCHSPSMVLYQPKMSREQWAKVVGKMKAVFKAPVEDSDVPAILDYLEALSAKVPGGTPTH